MGFKNRKKLNFNNKGTRKKKVNEFYLRSTIFQGREKEVKRSRFWKKRGVELENWRSDTEFFNFLF